MTLQHEATRIAVDPQTFSLRREFRAAVEQLARAAAYAMDTHESLWDFAVEIQSLTQIGLTTSDLRWLVSKGYLEHARETTRDGDPRRRFQPCRHLAFGGRTCFVLTHLGTELAAARGLGLKESYAYRPATLHAAPSPRESARCLPTWDNQRRILRVGEQIVKQYRVPSFCQEAILAAFEEEGWPPAIDDPLPPHPEQDQKRRLRDTVKSLNTNQKNTLLCFRGDGSGLRVLWELTEPAESVSVALARGGARAA